MISLLLILVSVPFQTSQARHPVRWTSVVGPPSRQALQAKLKRPVKLPRGQKIYEHTGRKSEIRTCADYTRAKKNGWRDDANGYERATEGFFKDQCDATLLILAAKPSSVSYVKNFRLDEAVLDSLPPSLSFTPFGELEEAADSAERQELSWKKFKPGLKLLEKDENWMKVEEPGEARIELEIKGFGDLNGDGIEDILLFKTDTVIEGTFYAHYPVILTRFAAGGPVKAFKVEDDDIEKAAAKVLHIAGSNQADKNDKAAPSEKVSEKAIHIVERFLASNKNYHLLALTDVPKTVLDDERSGKSWASRGLTQADMLAFAVMEGDPNGDGIEDVVAIIVSGDNDHKLYSLICLNGGKRRDIPAPFWVIKDSSHFIGNVYIISQTIFVIYDDLGNGGWVPDEDYQWNGSAYEEGYFHAGVQVCCSPGKKMFSLPRPSSRIVKHFKTEGAELKILSAVPRKVAGVRWYRVQVLRNHRSTRIVGFVSRDGLNPDC